MSFQPGQTGNPNGRAKGSSNRVTVARKAMTALLEKEGLSVMKAAIKLAKQGEPSAVTAVLDRWVPKLKPMQIAAPMPLNPELDDAANRKELIGALAAGEISIDDGATLLGALKLGPAAGGVLSIVIDLGPIQLPAPPLVIENGEGA